MIFDPPIGEITRFPYSDTPFGSQYVVPDVLLFVYNSVVPRFILKSEKSPPGNSKIDPEVLLVEIRIKPFPSGCEPTIPKLLPGL